MTIELSAAALAASPAALPPSGVQAGYGVSLTDLSGFNDALRNAQARGGESQLQAQHTSRVTPAVQALFQPLEYINGEAAQLHTAANTAAEAGQRLTPGEMVMLTVRCQEFMFHCQLTSNIANRASDGLQQLFRQQS
jgi:hypothetical protein